MVADENIDTRIILDLRNLGYKVISIREEFRGITDEKVIEIVKANEAILLTEDSDFGEWVFVHKIVNIGVVFLRYRQEELESIIDSIKFVLKKYNTSLHNKFIVITVKKIRIREIM
jgi:predicted nuclease of predicted toxin-antitoxin system